MFVDAHSLHRILIHIEFTLSPARLARWQWLASHLSALDGEERQQGRESKSFEK